MANNEQVKRLIEALVQREVKRLLPEAVKQVMSGIISEAVVDFTSTRQHESVPMGNSYKRQALAEVHTDDAWPTLGGGVLDRSRMADVMGYGDMRPSSRGTGVVIDSYLTEQGTPVPIDPNSIAPELQKALNRDYTELVKAWDKKRNG